MATRRRIALWLTALVFGAGCTCCPCGAIGAIGPSPDLANQDVVGTYRSDDGTTITLKSDGTYDAAAMRVCLDRDTFSYPNPQDSANGTWTLGDAERLNPYQTVSLDWDGLTTGTELLANGHELLIPIGDPDAHTFCYLERQ